MEDILNDIIFDNNPVIVGVSAGPDSMCLLDLLQKKTNKIVVCHVNHNVREESKIEEEYIKNYCKEHNLSLEVMTIDNYTENNFENEARKKRYAFYEEVMHKYNSNKLFLAHHGDDLIETVLMKIIRGSNIEGYAGIKYQNNVKNYQIIRPLLKVTKEDILKYNKDNNIKYFIDSSNDNTNYTRNRIRKNILPLLKEEDNNINTKFLKYSNTLLEYDNYIKKVVKNNINTIYKDNKIYINELLKLDKFIIKNTLYYILNNIYNNKDNIITENHVENIIKLIKSNKPNQSLNLPSDKVLIKEYDIMYIKNKDISTSFEKIEFNDNLEINNFFFTRIDKIDLDNNYICRLNSKEITLPLYFRSRNNKDYILLKTTGNKKKVKDIFIEKKIPLTKRNNYPILVDANNNILWIPGLKKSNFCIKKDEIDKNYDIIIKCNEREENYE